MKSFICFSIFAVFLHGVMAAEPVAVSSDTSKEVEQLLAGLPSQAELRQYYELSLSADATANPADKANATEQLKKFREGTAKLRKLLKVGTSIFAYPGLLAHGDISYLEISGGFFSPSPTPSKHGYRLFVGLPVRRTTPYDFEILFGNDGVISAINQVSWKE